MTQHTRYPAILDISLKVILSVKPGTTITPEIIARAAGAEYAPTVLADLRQAHMIDTDDSMTPLADRYASFWRSFLNRQAAKQ